MKLIKMPEGHYEMKGESGNCYCPFQPRIPMQQPEGLILIPVPCTSGCPHFRIDRDLEFSNNGKQGKTVVITCSGMTQRIIFDEEIEQKIHTVPFAKA